jgi:hypothetical protein
MSSENRALYRLCSISLETVNIGLKVEVFKYQVATDHLSLHIGFTSHIDRRASDVRRLCLCGGLSGRVYTRLKKLIYKGPVPCMQLFHHGRGI